MSFDQRVPRLRGELPVPWVRHSTRSPWKLLGRSAHICWLAAVTRLTILLPEIAHSPLNTRFVLWRRATNGTLRTADTLAGELAARMDVCIEDSRLAAEKWPIRTMPMRAWKTPAKGVLRGSRSSLKQEVFWGSNLR